MTCLCGHVEGLHEHYRNGTDCAGRKILPDYSGTTPCTCQKYRSKTTENLKIVGVVAAILVVGWMVLQAIAMSR